MEDQEEQAKKVSLLKTCIQPEQWVVIKELQKDGNQFSMVWKVQYKVVKMKPNLVTLKITGLEMQACVLKCRKN